MAATAAEKGHIHPGPAPSPLRTETGGPAGHGDFAAPRVPRIQTVGYGVDDTG